MPVWLFTLWTIGCLLSATEAAGELRRAVQERVLLLLGLGAGPASLLQQTAETIIQKTPHVVVFGVLGWLAARHPDGRVRRWLLGIAMAAAVAAELLQLGAAGRSFTFADMALNLAAVGTSFALRRRRAASDLEIPLTS